MTKNELRAQMVRLRTALTEQEREERSIAIANQCLQLPVWDRSNFHLFLSIETKAEVDTTPLLTLLQGRDKNIAVPKITGKHKLTSILLTDATKLIKTKRDLIEPQSGIEVDEKWAQVVFVPLLGVDKKGNRVGYGKGFYDSFLAQCSSDTKKIGVSFFEPEGEIEDLHSGDVPLDACVTPRAIHHFAQA